MNSNKWILIAFITLFGMAFNAQAQSEDNRKIKWLTFEEAVKMNRENPKKILLDVYTDWCGWCKRMDATTYKDPKVVEYVNDNYYAVKLDGEYKGEITFKGTTFKYVANGRKGYHELPAAIMQGKMSYPSTAFMDEKMNLITIVPGFQPTDKFHKVLSYVGGDYFKQTKWEDFETIYESLF